MSKPPSHAGGRREKKRPSSAHSVATHDSAARYRKRDWWLGGLGLTAIFFVAPVLYINEFDFGSIARAMERLNAAALISLMALLPLAGFSISVVYVIAGARFGPLQAGAVIVGVTAFHLVATHLIAQGFLRGPLERFLKKRRYHLPEIQKGDWAGLSCMAALVPGLPYFARNYLLALAGVPLRIYFWVCLPIYVARSYVAIFAGDLSGDFSGRKLAVLAGVYATKLAICGWVVARLRRRHKAQAEAAKEKRIS